MQAPEPPDLAALRAQLRAAADAYPELRRDIGRTLAAIERREAAAPTPPAQPLGAGIVGARSKRS